MPSKMHSFTRFLRSESSHFRRKVMAKLLRDENVPSQLRNIASVLNDPYPVFRFLQVFLLGVFIAMTVMAWFSSSVHAHHSVATVSNDLQGYQINDMKLNMATILENTIVLLLVVVIPHKGVWAHITTSSLRIWTLLVSPSITIFTVTITFVCFLTQAATKVLQFYATLIQQPERMSSTKRMAFAQEYVDKELWVKYGQLQQRLSNLLSNALQFTAEGQVVVCFWTKQGVPRKSVPTKLQDSCFQTFRKLFKDTYIYRQINAYFDAEGEDNYILEISGRKSKRDSQLIESRTQPRCSPMFTKGDEDGVLKIMGKNQRIGWQKPLSGRTILVAKDNTVSQKIAKLKELGACADCVDKDVDAVHLVSERFQNSQGSALSKEIPSSYCEAKKTLHPLKGLAGRQALTQGEPVQKRVAITLHCTESSVRVHARGRAHHTFAVDNLGTHSEFDQKTHLQKLEAGWCDKLGSVDAIQKEERRRQETAPTHEKAKSSAFAHQWKPHSRINYRQSGRRKSDGTNKGCNWLGCGMATYSWKTKGHLDAAKMDGSESISSNILDPLMDGTSMHSNYKMTCGRGRRSSGGYEKECSIRRDSRSKRSNSIASHQKARVNQQGSSIQLKPNQGGKGRKSALGRTQNRSTKSKQTKSCDQTHAGIAAVGGSSKNLCNYF
eukprot:TRINITY_DN778_c0_g1_i8.p1 TRINITY_DN778_c0_g1~~TRINITY_DN778_c0_g1_i8.p1  ORF type:complete len:665 (+),score=107.67 TRINITY_DN778_c0_g1_i8:343-2337(+)